MKSVFKADRVICHGDKPTLLYYAKRAFLVLDVFIQLMPVDTHDWVLIKLELMFPNSFT